MRQKIEMMIVDMAWLMVLLVLLTFMFWTFAGGVDIWMASRWGL